MTASNLQTSPARRRFPVANFLGAWFAVALVLASSGLIEQALSGRPWIIPVVLWSITLGMGALGWSWAPLRNWANRSCRARASTRRSQSWRWREITRKSRSP